MTRRVRTGALLAAGTLGVGAAIAIASVPDGTGVIHACYQVAAGGGTEPSANPGNVRIIDSGSQNCDAASERSLTWNQQGPQGSPGSPGIQGPPGAQGTLTAVVAPPVPDAGHAKLTFSGGRTRSGLAGTTLEFDVLSIGFGVTGPGAKGSGYTTKGSPPPVVHVTRRLDKYSNTLMKACASGQHLSKVVLKFGTKETFTLTNAPITSVQFSGGGPDRLTENDEFVAEKMTTQFSGGTADTLPALKYNAKLAGKL